MNIELILNVTMYQTHRFLKTTTKIQNIENNFEAFNMKLQFQ